MSALEAEHFLEADEALAEDGALEPVENGTAAAAAPELVAA